MSGISVVVSEGFILLRINKYAPVTLPNMKISRKEKASPKVGVGAIEINIRRKWIQEATANFKPTIRWLVFALLQTCIDVKIVAMRYIT